MSDQIVWYVELAVKSGALADFEKLTSETVAATRAEDGVLAYQRFISDDRQTIVVYERYLNSAAAIAHLQAFAIAFGECYDRMVEPKAFRRSWTPERRVASAARPIRRELPVPLWIARLLAGLMRPLRGVCHERTV